MLDTPGTNQAPGRLSNPLLDLTVIALEAQLRAWQAFQVESANFVAKRLRADLELAKALGHCVEAGHAGDCCRAWLSDLRADYAEECGRLAATAFSLVFVDLSSMGLLLGPRLWAKQLEKSVPVPVVRPDQERRSAA
jgi:hypothetical protein